MHELSHVGILQGDNLATQLGQGRTPCSAVQHAPSAYLAAFTDHPVLNLVAELLRLLPSLLHKVSFDHSAFEVSGHFDWC